MRIGFPISTMPEERRVALVPKHLSKIRMRGRLFFQKGYAEHLGIPDCEYCRAGANIVERKDLSSMDVLCLPKRWRTDVGIFSNGQTLMGWLYVPQSPWLQGEITNKGMTAIAFEKMFFENGKYVFQKNREITGVLGMLQALPYAGKPPCMLESVAILGNGNVAKSMLKVLRRFKIKYEIFTSKDIANFFAKLPCWDMIVSCVKYDFTKGPFIRNEHVDQMKPGCLIVDLSADGIEFSKPQKILSPVYPYRHIMVYNNEHIPSLWAGYSSEKISKALLPFINCVAAGKSNPVLEKATIARNGILQGH